MGFRTGVQFPSSPYLLLEKALSFQGFFHLQKRWVSKSSQKSSQTIVYEFKQDFRKEILEMLFFVVSKFNSELYF